MNNIVKNIIKSPKITFINKINDYKNVIGKCYIEPGGELIKHKHDIPEYYYLLNGRATMQLENKQLNLYENMFVKIPKDTYHCTLNNYDSTFVFLYMFPQGPFYNINYFN